MRLVILSNLYRFNLALLSIVFVFLSNSALAQKNLKLHPVNPEDVFITNLNGRAYTCAKINSLWQSGSLKLDGMFLTDQSRLQLLKRKIAKTRGTKIAKLEKRLARLKNQIKLGKRACKDGPPIINQPTPTPTATPTPTPIDPLRPLSRSMTRSDVQHLFKRAALGFYTTEQMQLGLNQGVQTLVNDLLVRRNDQEAENYARSWLNERNPNSAITTATGIQYYAYSKLVLTKNPLHNHLCMVHLHDIFALSVLSVNTTTRLELMLKYFDKLCRATDHGSYRSLVEDMTYDPAMLIWLDGALNNKVKPNENYARELQELFTVGTHDEFGNPNYTDLDVAQAARALTGYVVINTTQFGPTTAFLHEAFDNSSVKTIFRNTSYQSNAYDAQALIDAIFDRHPNTAYNIALMLTTRYVHPDIQKQNPALVRAVAQDLKANNYNMMSSLRKLLVSEVFYDNFNRNSILASPAEIAIHIFRSLHSTGIANSLDIAPFRPVEIRNLSNAGGMRLADPPSVFGWDRDKEFTVGSRNLSMANSLTSIVTNGNFNNIDNPSGWNYFKLFPAGNSAPTAQQMVERMSDFFGVTLKAKENEALVRYLNTQLRQVNVNGQATFVEVDDPWDPTNYAQARRKLAGLFRIFFGLKSFRVY